VRVERLQRDYDVDVTWLPFELHPDTPPEGRARPPRQDERYQASRTYLRQLAEAEGLRFQSNPIIANSRYALEASEYVRRLGGDHFERFHKRLFRAYLEERENIGLLDVVCRLATECGIAEAPLREALEGREFRDIVDRQVLWARQAGIGSTPTFIFNNQYAVIGAQDYPVFEEVMQMLGVPPRNGNGHSKTAGG
jgi:predicted DsbA family dithiol-disulfide isomerase